MIMRLWMGLPLAASDATRQRAKPAQAQSRHHHGVSPAPRGGGRLRSGCPGPRHPGRLQRRDHRPPEPQPDRLPAPAGPPVPQPRQALLRAPPQGARLPVQGQARAVLPDPRRDAGHPDLRDRVELHRTVDRGLVQATGGAAARPGAGRGPGVLPEPRDDGAAPGASHRARHRSRRVARRRAPVEPSRLRARPPGSGGALGHHGDRGQRPGDRARQRPGARRSAAPRGRRRAAQARPRRPGDLVGARAPVGRPHRGGGAGVGHPRRAAPGGRGGGGGHARERAARGEGAGDLPGLQGLQAAAAHEDADQGQLHPALPPAHADRRLLVHVVRALSRPRHHRSHRRAGRGHPRGRRR